MPIKQSKYKFLDYDSFVDCSKLKCTSIDKFGKWQFIGTILQDDIKLIIGTIKESPNETQEHNYFLLFDCYIKIKYIPINIATASVICITQKS